MKELKLIHFLAVRRHGNASLMAFRIEFERWKDGLVGWIRVVASSIEPRQGIHFELSDDEP